MKLIITGIGDIRSRLVRLIPTSNPELVAIKAFFNHRLPSTYEPARMEWLDLLETNHPLWTNISSPKRELIRSFLTNINLEMLKRLRPTSRFDFSGASIGNLFLTGSRLFTGSFEAAIYLLSSICAVPDSIAVLPALNTNFAHHIAAGLTDGTVITGQNNISHPSVPTAAVPQNPNRNPSLSSSSPANRLKRETEEQDKVEDANLPGTLPTLRKPAIKFSKVDEEDLPARIERLWYINPYGHEITIPANPRVIDAINGAGCVIYSIGSLFTSIVPSLVLKGVGEALASPLIKTKILILNGSIDRETGPSSDPFTAIDFVKAIAEACSESQGLSVPVKGEEYGRYVTHIVYLDGVGGPKVDRNMLGRLGIESMRLYGPGAGDSKGRYDLKGLEQVSVSPHPLSLMIISKILVHMMDVQQCCTIYACGFSRAFVLMT